MDQGLIKEYCDDFIAKLNDPDTAKYIEDDYFPIIWFGDTKAYETSKFKVVTMALNPSSKEFDGVRFQHQAKIRADLNAGKFPTDLESDLDNYFKFNPYTKWFNNFDQLALMKSFGVSYANGVVHIDLLTAIPTNPTWSGVDSVARSKFKRTDLALKLLKTLNPDILLIACSQDNFDTNFGDAILVKDYSIAGNRKLKLYNWNGLKLLHGSNTNGQPFSSVKKLFTNDTVTDISNSKF